MSTQIYRDNYTDFIYNEVRSSNMKVWITNRNDISMAATPKFQDTFVSPTFGQGRYLTSTSVTQTDFTLKCIAIYVTMQEWRAIQQWLSPLSSGKLQFQFNQFTYYYVKVSQQITGTTFVAGKMDKLLGDLYIIEFSITFTTVDDYAALGQPVTCLLNRDFGYEDKNNGEVLYKYTRDSVISNRYYMPAIYGYKEHNGAPTNGRVYVTSPTSLLNKLLYFDTKGFQSEGKEYNFSNYFYLIESNLISNEKDGINEIVPVAAIVITQIKEGNNISFSAKVVNIQGSIQFEETQINESVGISFYGLNLMLCSTKEQMEHSPFYYEEEPGTYYIMNSGAYDLYPTLYVNSGVSKDITIKLEDELVYDYTLNFNQSTLVFLCRYGIVTYNNKIAEAAILSASGTEVEVVSNSVNNGVLSIPSGRPEIMKCKILDVEKAKFGTITVTEKFSEFKIGDKTITWDDLKNMIPPIENYPGLNSYGNNLGQIMGFREDGNERYVDVQYSTYVDSLYVIYFQPFGDFKYSRNKTTAYHLFTGIRQELTYDTYGYPVYESPLVTNMGYGSTIENSIFSINSFVINDVKYTETDSEGAEHSYKCKALVVPIKDVDNQSNLNNMKNQTAYLSVCDATKLNIESGSYEGYAILQTRDAY